MCVRKYSLTWSNLRYTHSGEDKKGGDILGIKCNIKCVGDTFTVKPWICAFSYERSVRKLYPALGCALCASENGSIQTNANSCLSVIVFTVWQIRWQNIRTIMWIRSFVKNVFFLYKRRESMLYSPCYTCRDVTRQNLRKCNALEETGRLSSGGRHENREGPKYDWWENFRKNGTLCCTGLLIVFSSAEMQHCFEAELSSEVFELGVLQ